MSRKRSAAHPLGSTLFVLAALNGVTWLSGCRLGELESRGERVSNLTADPAARQAALMTDQDDSLGRDMSQLWQPRSEKQGMVGFDSRARDIERSLGYR